MKVDLHVHTSFSKDSFCPIPVLIRIARRRGIGCLAITDHDQIEGAIRAQELSNSSPQIIVGEEIMTSEGEITGLFLSQRIEPGLSPEDTVEKIKGQGGLVYLPHPFSGAKKRRGIFAEGTLHRIARSIDIVEVMNPRGIDVGASIGFAQRYGLLMGAGSDAHTPFEVGNAYVEMESFDGKMDFIEKLEKGKVRGGFAPGWYRLITNRFVRKGLRSFLVGF